MKTALITLAIIGGGASGATADTTPARENPEAIIDRAQQDLDRRIREAEDRVADVKAGLDKLREDEEHWRGLSADFAERSVKASKDVGKVAGNYRSGEKGAFKNGKIVGEHAAGVVGKIVESYGMPDGLETITKDRARLNAQLKDAQKDLRFHQQFKDYVGQVRDAITAKEAAAVQGGWGNVADATAASDRRAARERERAERSRRDSEGGRGRERIRGRVDVEGDFSVRMEPRGRRN